MVPTISVSIIIALLSALASVLAAGVRSRFPRDIRLVFKTGQSIVMPIKSDMPEDQVALKIDETIGELLPNESRSAAQTPSLRNAASFDWAIIQRKWLSLSELPLSKLDRPLSSALIRGGRRNPLTLRSPTTPEDAVAKHAPIFGALAEDKANEQRANRDRAELAQIVAAAEGRPRHTRHFATLDEEGEPPDMHAKAYAPPPRSLDRGAYHQRKEKYA